MKEILIGTTSSGISYQLITISSRNFYTCMYLLLWIIVSKVLCKQILNRISLQYAPNANEQKTQTKQAKNERTLDTNDTKNGRYTKRTHDTWNKCTIHERTNEMKHYPMTNNPDSIEVQYSIVLLFEWLLCKLMWLTLILYFMRNWYI